MNEVLTSFIATLLSEKICGAQKIRKPLPPQICHQKLKSVITNGVKTRLVSAHQARSACLTGFPDKALISELSPQCLKKALRNS